MSTRESVDYSGALRVTHGKSSPLEAFSRDTLLISVHQSVSHRKSALADARELTDTIIAQLLKLHTNGVIKASIIRDTTSAVLARFDNAAGVHYQAHHS